MKVLFNESMFTTFNLSLINMETVDIYVEPAQQRHKVESFDLSKVNLTWNVTSFDLDTLEIKLRFVSPNHISPLEV